MPLFVVHCFKFNIFFFFGSQRNFKTSTMLCRMFKIPFLFNFSKPTAYFEKIE